MASARWLLPLLAAAAPRLCAADLPTKQEITDAYQTSASGGSVGLGRRHEDARGGEVRGWVLRFKRFSEKSVPGGGWLPGVLRRKYRVVARQGGQCAEYMLTEVIPDPRLGPTLAPSIDVEAPAAAKPCK